MTHKFSELREKMTPEARAESAKLFQEALAKMPFHELELTAETPAETIPQGARERQSLRLG